MYGSLAGRLWPQLYLDLANRRGRRAAGSAAASSHTLAHIAVFNSRALPRALHGEAVRRIEAGTGRRQLFRVVRPAALAAGDIEGASSIQWVPARLCVGDDFRRVVALSRDTVLASDEARFTGAWTSTYQFAAANPVSRRNSR
jgi:hypothetical protein